MPPPSTEPVILYDILPNVDNRQQRPYAILPNPWITRLVLKAKNIPFVVRPITIAELRATGPNSVRARLGDTLGPADRPHIPFIEHEGRLIADSLTIADYLDARFPDSPSSHLPAISSADAHSEQQVLALRLARDAAIQARSLVVSGHVPLVYERATDAFDEASKAWFRSDEKFGQRNAYARLLRRDKAAALAELRTFLSGYFAILQPLPFPRIEGLAPSSTTTEEISRLLPQHSTAERLFLSSPSAPGLVDYTLFAWYIFTYTADRELNEGIWSDTSDKARSWLGAVDGGAAALSGEDTEVGQWQGDVVLPGVAAWVERMLSLYEDYPRRILGGEVLEGEPKTL